MAFPPMQTFRVHKSRPSTAHGSKANPIVITAAAPIISFTPINAAPSYSHRRPEIPFKSRPATPTFSTCGLLPREPQRPALSPRHTLSPSLSVLTLPPLLSLPSSQSPTAAGPHTLIHAPAGPPLKPLDHGFYLRGPEVARGEGEEKDEEGEESAGKCVILPEIETSVENRGGGTKAMELGGGSVKGGDVRITGVKEIQIGAWTPAAVRRETTGREKRERQAYEPVKRVLETESMARQQCRKMERKERGPVARMGKTRVLMMAKRLRMRLEDPGMMSHSPWTTV